MFGYSVSNIINVVVEKLAIKFDRIQLIQVQNSG